MPMHYDLGTHTQCLFRTTPWEHTLSVCSCPSPTPPHPRPPPLAGAAFLMWELSTPFMYIRWLMLKAGLGSSAAMPLANVAFMLVFFGCRNVWGPGEAAPRLRPRPGAPCARRPSARFPPAARRTPWASASCAGLCVSWAGRCALVHVPQRAPVPAAPPFRPCPQS